MPLLRVDDAGIHAPLREELLFPCWNVRRIVPPQQLLRLFLFPAWTIRPLMAPLMHWLAELKTSEITIAPIMYK
jgi:hypothetical protein